MATALAFRGRARNVLDSADDVLVLVGGQALAVWMAFYRIDVRGALGNPISRDVDFYTDSARNTAPLKKFADAIGGAFQIAEPREFTALVGTAIAPFEGRSVNVDLIHTVVGVAGRDVQANAVALTLASGKTLRVMHPLDVLVSRNANLHTLVEKQDEAGCDQLRFAIHVVRAYLAAEIDRLEADAHLGALERARALRRLFNDVIAIARKSAARKNAERYAIHVADAIPAGLPPSRAFWGVRWRHVRELMSPEHARRVEADLR